MADFKYTYQLSQFPNNIVDLDTLADQIRASAIIVALDYVGQEGSDENNFFKAELSPEDVSILNDVIAAHTGVPAPQEIPIVRSEVLTEHIQFIESGDTTQSMYSAESIIIDISAGEYEKIVDITWPYPIALMSGTLGVAEYMIGDGTHVEVGPNTLVGAFIQNLNVGDTSVYVSPTVFQNIKRGFYINVYNPTPGWHGPDIGQVINLDEANNCLELLNPSDISVGAGNYVAMSAKIIPNLFFHDTHTIEIGKQIPTGQRIPPNIPLRVHYFNNNGVAKTISFFIEYLY